jgi:uncharacterized protein (TIGR03089 family)
VPSRTVPDLLTDLLREPGRPRLTWYGPDGERVELSGAVVGNWVAKTANLLVEELDAGPGTRVVLDLPPHWRTVLWALASWRVGACVVVPHRTALPVAATGDHVVVTDRPEPGPPGSVVVAVPLAALARRFDGTLPAGAIDAGSSVMTYGDVLGWVPDLDPGGPALQGPGVAVAHDGLLSAAGSAAPAESRARVLLPVADDDDGAGVLLRVLGTLASDGSVVLVRPDGAGPERLERISADERVTSRAGA